MTRDEYRDAARPWRDPNPIPAEYRGAAAHRTSVHCVHCGRDMTQTWHDTHCERFNPDTRLPALQRMSAVEGDAIVRRFTEDTA